jgi:hypothetical protein
MFEGLSEEAQLEIMRKLPPTPVSTDMIFEAFENLTPYVQVQLLKILVSDLYERVKKLESLGDKNDQRL